MKKTVLFSLLSLLLVACKVPEEFAPAEETSPPPELQAPADDAIMDEDDAMMENETDGDTVMEEDEMMEDDPMDESAGTAGDDMAIDAVYTAYADGVLANGETKVLFFHAPWCPFCIRNDGRLKAMYDSGSPQISTYKVDFDTSTELKSRYGVVTQDTVVLVDGSGNTLDLIMSPGESDLRTLVE